MYLQAETIYKILTKEFGFIPVLQKDGTPYDKVYKLECEGLDHLICINRKLKNHKILAIPLKHHVFDETFKKIDGLDKGNISDVC